MTVQDTAHAELVVIGACIADPTAFSQVSDMLVANDFADGQLRTIWRALSALMSAGTPIDFSTVEDRLEADGLIDAAGGRGYPTRLSSDFGWTRNLRINAESVAKASLARRVADAGAKISKLTGDSALAEAQAILSQLTDQIAVPTKSSHAAIRELVQLFQFQTDRSSDMLGVSTGIPHLDHLTAGMVGGDLWVFAGRPSMGKTLLAVQIAFSAAMNGRVGHVLSLEMPTVNLMQRAVAAASEVPYNAIRDAKKVQEGQWNRVTNAATEIGQLPLYFDDGVHELHKITARIRQLHASKGTRVVVIDYLQMMILPASEKNLTQAIQDATRELKRLARELDITLILISQLNRSLESRTDKRPIMSDLRDSGSIEQDADLIAFIYRDEYYNPGSYLAGYAELIVRKQRNGETGTVPLRSRLDIQRFDSAPDGLPEEPAQAPKSTSGGKGSFRRAASSGASYRAARD